MDGLYTFSVNAKCVTEFYHACDCYNISCERIWKIAHFLMKSLVSPVEVVCKMFIQASEV
jgi:hypothetical protein